MDQDRQDDGEPKSPDQPSVLRRLAALAARFLVLGLMACAILFVMALMFRD